MTAQITVIHGLTGCLSVFSKAPFINGTPEIHIQLIATFYQYGGTGVVKPLDC